MRRQLKTDGRLVIPIGELGGTQKLVKVVREGLGCDNHGTRRKADELLRDAAEQKAREATVSAPPHNDGVASIRTSVGSPQSNFVLIDLDLKPARRSV